jgi:molybdate transport repressor ModE-like protein
MSERFDLTDLRLFLRILEAGSITAGAQSANLSLAAASARVLGMERVLVAPLLNRGRRGITPTAAGLTLEKHAREVINLAGRMQLNMELLVRNEKKHLSIAGTSAAIREYLPDTLGDFLTLHPQVNISVFEAIGDEAVQAVLGGVADISFVTTSTSVNGLESLPFVMNRFALVVPAAHPLAQEGNRARGRSISIVAADFYDIVGLNAGSALQDAWEKRAADRGIRLKYRVRVPSFDAQLRLVEQGVGIAMLPEATARRAARTLSIEVLPLSDAYLVKQLLVCARRFSELSVDGKNLIQMLLPQQK